MQEQELIRRCNANERKAQRMLYDQYAPLILSVCRRYTGPENAEDVMQDSFIRVFSYLAQYRGDGSFEGWIRRVAVNTCIRHLEKAKRLKIDLYGENMPEFAVQPDAISQMSANELLSLIDKIPDGYKTVFNLSIIEGYQHKEIAKLLGIEESSSRSQLTKARKYIQRSLEITQKVTL